MGKFVKGDVVIIPFPFSDLSEVKKRPAFVVSKLKGDDVILCQITSKMVKDKYSISLLRTDFAKGNLLVDSNIRPNRIFTADKGLVLYKVGNVKEKKTKEIIRKIVEIINN